MSIETIIKQKLTEVLSPSNLNIINESDQHASHAGSPGTGESHFRIYVVSQKFDGKSRIERHRMINEALAEELSGAIHALAIKALTPDEA